MWITVSEQIDTEIKQFVVNIVYLRKRHNLSKKEMAQILGIGIGSYNKLEQGIFPERLAVDVIFNISDYFKIPPAHLFEKLP